VHPFLFIPSHPNLPRKLALRSAAGMSWSISGLTPMEILPMFTRFAVLVWG
jgi:hypothetical protein